VLKPIFANALVSGTLDRCIACSGRERGIGMRELLDQFHVAGPLLFINSECCEHGLLFVSAEAVGRHVLMGKATIPSCDSQR